MARHSLMGLMCVVALAGFLAGCGDDDSGVGPAGPQGEVGPGGIAVDADEGTGIPGSGNIVVDTREVESFDSISLAGEGSVIVTSGPSAALTIEADDNLIGYLESTVVDATLRINTAVGIDIDPTEPPVYRIAVPELVELELLGAGEIRTAGWTADTFTISMRGVGDVHVDDLTVGSLFTDVAGVGSVTVSGTADSQAVTMAGVTVLEAADLRSGTAELACGDAAIAEVWVVDTLDIVITGTGTVSYYGSPTVTMDAGNGTVSPLGSR